MFDIKYDTFCQPLAAELTKTVAKTLSIFTTNTRAVAVNNTGHHHGRMPIIITYKFM